MLRSAISIFCRPSSAVLIIVLMFGSALAIRAQVPPASEERPETVIDGVVYVRALPSSRKLEPSQTVLRFGTEIRTGGRALTSDILVERDVPIKLRDGVTIYADVYRPAGAGRSPVIIAWSPYGKNEGGAPAANVAASAVSGLQKFEGPDPAYWCAHGYAVLNTDSRGAYNSEGNIRFWGDQDASDGYDVVEWVAAQPWSTGKVAFSGNSWLAIAQWFIAAARPPHLSAIAPWEGLSDVYRDTMGRGGVPDGFFNSRVVLGQHGGGYVEDPALMLGGHPMLDAYWQDKVAALRKIDIPAYIVASYTNGLHTDGTFHGWEVIQSKAKWLRIHNTHEWPDYYAHEDDLRAFFDHFLKDEPNGWEKTPRVRFSVLNPGGQDRVDLPAATFPLPNTRYKRLYLDAASKGLGVAAPHRESRVAYPSQDSEGEAAFTFAFKKPADLVGHFNLHAWVSSDSSNDMDLFVYLQKLDSSDNLLEPNVDDQTWPGQDARLRVSHREIDRANSTAYRVLLRHDRYEPLKPGVPVPVDISIQPLGMHWEAGQKLRVVIAGHRLGNIKAPPLPLINKGNHSIHTGGKYQSYLTVPAVEGL